IKLTAKLITCVAGFDKVYPVGFWLHVLSSDDLNDVAVSERFIKGVDCAVHLKAVCMVANVAMNAVGKVERQRSFREIINVTIWGVYENTVREEVDVELVA